MVEDLKCDLSTLVQIYEFDTIDNLKRTYAQVAHRILTPGSTISLDHNQNLPESSTLEECGISDMKQVYFQNPSYNIVVKDILEDASLPTNLQVADHFTVQMVKEAFSERTDKLWLLVTSWYLME